MKSIWAAFKGRAILVAPRAVVVMMAFVGGCLACLLDPTSDESFANLGMIVSYLLVGGLVGVGFAGLTGPAFTSGLVRQRRDEPCA